MKGKYTRIKKKYRISGKAIVKRVLPPLCSGYFAVFFFMADSGRIKNLFCRIFSGETVRILCDKKIGGALDAIASSDWIFEVVFLLIGCLILGLYIVICFFCGCDECKIKRLMLRADIRIEYLRSKIKSLMRKDSDMESYWGRFDIFKGNLGFISQVYLSVMANWIHMGSEGCISLYFYQKSSDSFRKLQCFSKNNVYMRAGAEIYLRNDSIVWRAWNEGSVFVDSLPDPNNDFENYLEEQEKLGHLREHVRNMKIKPRFYFAQRIGAPDGVNSIGVLLIESVKACFKKKSSLEHFIERHHDFLSRFLSDFGDVIPHLSIATSKGL